MGWRINCIKNTVEISDDLAEKIFEVIKDEGFYYEEPSDVVYKGKLHFDSDHMEWMDFVWHVDDLMAENGAEGEIAFSDTEGDQRGQWWKYTFADGVCTKTNGLLADLV